MAMGLGRLFGSSDASNTLTTNSTPSYPSGLTVGGALGSSMQQAIIEDQYRRMTSMTEDHYRREYNLNTENGRRVMISMRLRLNEGDIFPFQHMSTARTGDKVYVFVVQNDQPVTLEDDAPLFPSDTLVTQLRLMMK